ncbi:dephospho-CoA kinase [Magnetovibrio sp. PR-2]|uniref:dephospho-CoA kinase n=1 Tax=Magnetovibrio sp. PR-2 TaxID=3120356 RepID=UPI002FCDE3AF
MVILGLTGSIGMGKSWGGRCFQTLGVPLHDADACVHRLMGPNGAAVKDVAAAFPGVLNAQGGVDRQKLGARVLDDDVQLKKLEDILHPQVRADQKRFLARAQRTQAGLVVLDIPLLFETGARSRVDAVVVMSAPQRLQRQRVLRRPGMTAQKFEAILDRQTPDSLKRQLAHFVVNTGGTKGETLRQITNLVKVAKTWPAKAWSPHWS